MPGCSPGRWARADADGAPTGLLGFVLNLLAQLFHIFAEAFGGLAAGGRGQGKSEGDKDQGSSFWRRVHGQTLADRPSGCYEVNTALRRSLLIVAG